MDTSFWVALQVPRDRRHTQAVDIWKSHGGPLRTSNLVMGETWTWLRRRAGHGPALRFVTSVHQSQRVSVAVVNEAIDEQAWLWLSRHGARSYSYVDATSFEIMRRERITEALAFDADFTSAGFIEVRSQS